MRAVWVLVAAAPAAQTNQAQVPFWLQVVSIALAPLVGFIGVAIGVLLAERNRRDAYVKDKRRETYQNFLEASVQLSAFFHGRVMPSIRHASAEEKDAVGAEILNLSEKLTVAYLHVMLIGSGEATEMANKMFPYLMVGSGRVLDMMDGKFSQEKEGEFIDYGTHVQQSFVKAARKDLGLRRKEWAIDSRLIKHAKND